MSFSFTYAGTLDDVKAQVRSHHFTDHPGDAHAARVRDFVHAELGHFPESAWFNGALVEASGHSDSNGYNLSLTIRPLHLLEVLPEGGTGDALADERAATAGTGL